MLDENLSKTRVYMTLFSRDGFDFFSFLLFALDVAGAFKVKWGVPPFCDDGLVHVERKGGGANSFIRISYLSENKYNNIMMGEENSMHEHGRATTENAKDDGHRRWLWFVNPNHTISTRQAMRNIIHRRTLYGKIS